MRGFKVLGGAMALLIGTAANAQVFQFPPQNPQGPRGAYEQVNYPYPGQCQADPAAAIVWGVPACGDGLGGTIRAKSFECPAGAPAGVSNFTAGGWRSCLAAPGAAPGFNVLSANPVLDGSKYIQPFLNPFDYIPDTTKFPGADFYDIGLHEAWGYQNVASLGTTIGLPIVPDPLAFDPTRPPIPNGMQWTGLICNPSAPATECTCPAELAVGFQAAYCNGVGGGIPAGAPLYTPIWGVGQRNSTGPAVASILGVTPVASPWSANNYVATWPSVSIRANKGTPVVVRWTNEFPNNHTFCPHPEAADWPCAIDRTFMGVKAAIDPAAVPSTFFDGFRNTTSTVSYHGVNQFGGAQQPDNSWVTHLHGGDIPPATDGFAEKWYGNAVSGALYSPTKWFLTPALEAPIHPLFRPGGAGVGTLPAQSWNADTYTYPMDQEEALIWFHDHTLGKTHHNVIAGPAGFFPVRDPAKHGAIAGGVCTPVAPATDCEFTWLDPITLPKLDLGVDVPALVGTVPPGVVQIPKYDFFMAIQDRAFNDDGSINFSNGLGNAPDPAAPPEITYVTPGDNSLVHPTWLPEYFGDHMLVNGILWPKAQVEPGVYRIRMANGSDSRCYTLGFSTVEPVPGTRPTNNVPFSVIASDQGYVPVPRAMSSTPVTFCPGERLELLVNFAGRTNVWMTNSAGSPFPAGETPFTPGTPWPHTNSIMQFAVGLATASTVPACAAGTQLQDYNPANPTTVGCIALPDGLTNRNSDPAIAALRALVQADGTVATGTMCATPVDPRFGVSCVSAVRQLYLNERVDGTTGAPLGMQINGVPFEYKVTETPKRGSIEVWQIINLTVDAHPMHPHLVKHLRVGRQSLNVGAYKTALCGSSTCQPGPSPGNEMPVIPDVRALFGTTSALVGPFRPEIGNVMNSWKDASQSMPGEVLTIIAKWDGHYHTARPTQIAATADVATTPGSAAGPADLASCPGGAGCDVSNWTYEPVTSGPFVWHCHINSHEDSEMMRTSLVIE